MGKRYYCDYCNRAFPDNAQNRKKHLQGVLHQKLKKQHYDSFRDTAAVLQNEFMKKPCQKFHQSGTCQFESECKYSHLSPGDFENLKRAAIKEAKLKKEAKKPKPIEFDLEAWLEKREERKENPDKPKHTTASKFPGHLLTNQNLTPSLIPARPEDYLADLAEWGN